MTLDDVKAITQASFERDWADFDLDAKIEMAIRQSGVDSRFAMILTDSLRAIAPILYECAYYDGCLTGMDVAQDIHGRQKR